jgi:hypothetical protein
MEDVSATLALVHGEKGICLLLQYDPEKGLAAFRELLEQCNHTYIQFVGVSPVQYTLLQKSPKAPDSELIIRFRINIGGVALADFKQKVLKDLIKLEIIEDPEKVTL